LGLAEQQRTHAQQQLPLPCTLVVCGAPHLNKLRRTMNDFLAMKNRKKTTPGPMPSRRYPKKAVAAMMTRSGAH